MLTWRYKGNNKICLDVIVCFGHRMIFFVMDLQVFVDEVMELELISLSGALVGLPGVDGLPTEQWKRLTIAVELVDNPAIVFMDEPTSGLDARAATIVMRTVRNIVNTENNYVHNPSAKH